MASVGEPNNGELVDGRWVEGATQVLWVTSAMRMPAVVLAVHSDVTSSTNADIHTFDAQW